MAAQCPVCPKADTAERFHLYARSVLSAVDRLKQRHLYDHRRFCPGATLPMPYRAWPPLAGAAVEVD